MLSRRILPLAGFIVLVLQLALPGLAQADGIIIIEPPICRPGPCPGPIPIAEQLEIRFHRVDVTIRDQVATTRIDQVFHNPNDWPAEGTYIFPIPDGATIGEFLMWVDGQRIEANILEADEARQVYDDIVRKLRDPALLEYIGQGAIQASVFPIPPGEDRRIEIEYSEVLVVENGLLHYVYPLNTERFSAQLLEQVSVRVEVDSHDPVRAIYSPSHDIAIDRADDYHFVVGYEESDVRPETDFELYYTVSAERIATNLISYFDTRAEEGFFMLLAAPGIEASDEVIDKDVIVVLDTSGSMHGEKLEQAKTALTFVLEQLNRRDRFNVYEFSTGVRSFARELQPAREADEAIEWVERLEAIGGTDINRALLEAMATVQRGRPAIVIFLTDGLPTEGEIEVDRILDNVSEAAPDNVRLFAFGVGDDVDTLLLDTLVQAHHGSSTYVRPGQRLDEIVSAFYARVRAPVLADLELDFADIHVEDTYPTPLPDLFAGTQLVLLGRYREGGPTTITLRGEVNGEPRSFRYEDAFFRRNGGEDFLPRLWATRRIGHLLNQIRLHGEREEWVAAIVDLSVKYGIVTPYTSYLITEDDILTIAGRESVAAQEFDRLQVAPSAPSSGAGAVSEAEALGAMADADVMQVPAEAYREAVKVVGSRAFVYLDGIWTETAFDPSQMTAAPVQFASDDYFRLLAARPDLGPAFALGTRVIALSGDEAFEVILDDAPPLGPVPARPTAAVVGQTGGAPEAAPTQDVPSTVEPANVATAEQEDGERSSSGRPAVCLNAAPLLVGLVLIPRVVRRKRPRRDLAKIRT